MPTYDFSKEPSNPWDAATWDPKAQIDFMRRTRANWPNLNAEVRIKQRIAASDTKGMPPKNGGKPPVAPYQVIVQRRFLVPPTKDTTLGFGFNGPIAAFTQWTMPIVTQRVQFPSSITPSEARCDTAPTDDQTLVLSTADNTVLCTITFAAGSTVGTFLWSAPASLVIQPGDELFLFAPGPQDATWAGLNLAFIGRQLGGS